MHILLSKANKHPIEKGAIFLIPDLVDFTVSLFFSFKICLEYGQDGRVGRH